MDDSTGELRESPWLTAIGPDYIALAFQFAHEADPDAKLYYNDYSAEGVGGKGDAVYELVKGLKEQGVPIHGDVRRGGIGVGRGNRRVRP